MAEQRYKIRNRAYEPAPGKTLKGFTTHPEIGGRVLPPRATRFLLRSEITERILDDVDKYVASGAISFQAEFGRPVEVDTAGLRVALGFHGVAPALTPTPRPELRGRTVEAMYVDELAHFEPVPESSGQAQAEHMEALVAAQKVLAEEHLVPIDVVMAGVDVPEKSLADLILDEVAPTPPAHVMVVAHTAETLAEKKGPELDEILVGTFGQDPKQLYKIGNKGKKVERILELQAAAQE